MIAIPSNVRVFLGTEPQDFRKSIDGLAWLDRTWPQYEVEIAASKVRRPKPWSPVSAQELKQKPPKMANNRQVGERARRWQRLMDEKVYPNMSALARAEGVTPAAVSKALIRLQRGEPKVGEAPCVVT